jgi:hypothetical protein
MKLQVNDKVLLIRETDDSYCRIEGVVESIEDFSTNNRACIHTIIRTNCNGHISSMLLVNGFPFKGSYEIIKC